MFKRGFIFVLCMVMLLPVIAAAENTVEILPTTPPMPDLVLEKENPYAFEDLSAYYDYFRYEYQLPSLTDSEREGLPKAQRHWDAGERPETGILNLTENVHVALIQVPAEQYEGENWFLLLPNRELTHEELLQIVDAFEQMGITFSADMLSWHNTLRGGAIEIALRGFREDEEARYTSLGMQFSRLGLRSETPFTDSAMDDGLGHVTLDENDYNGLGEYAFFPARRMTDEELLQLYSLRNAEYDISLNDSAYYDLASYEAMLRKELHAMMGMPLSARRSLSESVQPAGETNVYGDTRVCYNTSFGEADDAGGIWSGSLDITTGKLVWAKATLDDVYYNDDGIHSGIRLDPWDERWADIALQTVADLRTEGADGLKEPSLQGETSYNNLYCASVRIETTEGGTYRVQISFVTEAVARLEYNDDISMALEDEWTVHMISQEKSVETQPAPTQLAPAFTTVDVQPTVTPMPTSTAPAFTTVDVQPTITPLAPVFTTVDVQPTVTPMPTSTAPAFTTVDVQPTPLHPITTTVWRVVLPEIDSKALMEAVFDSVGLEKDTRAMALNVAHGDGPVTAEGIPYPYGEGKQNNSFQEKFTIFRHSDSNEKHIYYYNMDEYNILPAESGFNAPRAAETVEQALELAKRLGLFAGSVTAEPVAFSTLGRIEGTTPCRKVILEERLEGLPIRWSDTALLDGVVLASYEVGLALPVSSCYAEAVFSDEDGLLKMSGSWCSFEPLENNPEFLSMEEALEFFHRAGLVDQEIEASALEQCWFLNVNGKNATATLAYRFGNSYLNAVDGTWLQIQN